MSKEYVDVSTIEEYIDMFDVFGLYPNNIECSDCGSCKHAINRREWDDKIDYGNGTYDIIYCEEITCEIDGKKYPPSMFYCEGIYCKNFEKI